MSASRASKRATRAATGHSWTLTLLAISLTCSCSAPAPGLAADPPSLSAPAASSLQSLAWLAGRWHSTDEDGHVSEELWMAPNGGLMLGLNRTVSHSTAFEYLRIEARDDGTVAYVPSPGGQETSAFILSEGSENSATFVNPENTFPTHIRYQLGADASTLTATISAEVDGVHREMSWTWLRVEGVVSAP
ncbi:MAG: hypothetical protein ACJA1R_001330 [Flavobacteriales bacterium]|jgi:hypothetical protein